MNIFGQMGTRPKNGHSTAEWALDGKMDIFGQMGHSTAK